jgi:hypothetical protein
MTDSCNEDITSSTNIYRTSDAMRSIMICQTNGRGRGPDDANSLWYSFNFVSKPFNATSIGFSSTFFDFSGPYELSNR